MTSAGYLNPAGDAQDQLQPAWITVLMPVYNGQRFIHEAIDSILAQTYPHFEFLIINDGSTDSTADILNDYAARDARIRVIHQSNIDQPATLNRGLLEARHDWVAIIDHDDVSLPRRLERQASAIVRNPEARVVGAYGFEINAKGVEFGRMAFGPTNVSDFRDRRSRNEWMGFIHSSVVIHRPTILALGGYRDAFGSAADSDLWSRVADDHPVIAVPEYLVKYRVHLSSMSYMRFFDQQRMVRWIRACQDNRRAGQPEPSLAELIEQERGLLFIGWLKLQRYDWMMHFLRRRRLYRSEGSSLPASICFLLASMLSPVRSLKRIGSRVVGRSGIRLHSTTPDVVTTDSSSATPLVNQ